MILRSVTIRSGSPSCDVGDDMTMSILLDVCLSMFIVSQFCPFSIQVTMDNGVDALQCLLVGVYCFIFLTLSPSGDVEDNVGSTRCLSVAVYHISILSPSGDIED